MYRRLLLLLTLIVAAGPMRAQVDTGVINGTVHDQGGAVIPSAQVTITSQSTGVSVAVSGDAQGSFTSPPLRPDTYWVAVSMPGFQLQTRTGIRLQVQDRPNFDFKMAVGQVSQYVSVSDASPAIHTGVIGTSVGTNSNTGGSSTGGQDSFAADGARGTLNNFLLDGIDNNSNDNGESYDSSSAQS